MTTTTLTRKPTNRKLSSTTINGAELLLEMLADCGVRYLFGNPGTTELPLSDAVAHRSIGDPGMEYIVGLHEAPVMSMADGYSMASQSLGFVNLHISCGVGNAMGMLYNAYRAGTPLLVTAGQTDRRMQFEEPIIWGEMVEVVKPWTKWAHEVNRIEDLPNAIRRAVQAALTPPTGPVFLSLPIDLQMELVKRNQLDTTTPKLPDPHVRPPVGALEEAVEVLLKSENGAIIVGSRVQEADAVNELVAVAERLGFPVISESGTTHGRLSFPCDHPLYGQGLPLFSPEVRERLNQYDTLLIAGMDVFRHYLYTEPSRPIPEHIKLVHIDQDPWQLGKNYPVEVGLIGHLKPGLAEIDTMLQREMTSEQVDKAKNRTAEISHKHNVQKMNLINSINEQYTERPMTSLVAMSSIARALPKNVAVVEEAVTTTNTILERLGALKNTDGYFGHRGWTLGWGVGVTMGVQLAWPDRPTLGIIGDGSLMFGIQGLWTAAKYNLPVTYVIPNNAQYQILKIGAKGFRLPGAQEDKFVGLDMDKPEIDIVSLAQSMGVNACRVHEPGELTSTLKEALASNDGPRLIEVPICREVPDKLNYG